MLKHLKWAEKKVKDLREDDDSHTVLLEVHNTLHRMDRNQLEDIVMYLMGRVNERQNDDF